MNQELLSKFFKGTCSPEEYQAVVSWYLSGNADQELADKIEAVWEKDQMEINKEWGKEEVFQNLISQINFDSEVKKPTNSFMDKIEQHTQSFSVWKYAASILICLAIGAWWLVSSRNDDGKLVREFVTFTENVTPRGKRLTVDLRDGTIIYLNAESRIRYKENLASESIREVFLEGEAFFEVAKDSLRPFIVHTGNIKTVVLGTSFNVNAYKPKEEISVAVVTGKVQVSTQNKKDRAVQLKPEEQATWSRQHATIRKEKSDSNRVAAWKEGTLNFKNEDFSDIVETLERWYGVEIEVKNMNIEKGFSGSYKAQPLETVLEGMSFVLKFDYENKNGKVIIK
jgi:ferric-dicitrate binding protein FerR (iron transport regulator)